MSAATISTTVASLISAAVGLAGTGVGAYEANNASVDSSANQAFQKNQLAQQQQAQATQANLSKQEAVLGASGQTQQQTGGSLTDPGTSALTDLLAGYPGYQSGSGGTGTGTTSGAGTATSATPGPSPSGVSTDGSASGGAAAPNIAAILAALRGQGGGAGGAGAPSSISGGNWQSQPAAPQSQFELANPLV